MAEARGQPFNVFNVTDHFFPSLKTLIGACFTISSLYGVMTAFQRMNLTVCIDHSSYIISVLYLELWLTEIRTQSVGKHVCPDGLCYHLIVNDYANMMQTSI